MEEYKGYYIEEYSWTPDLMPSEYAVYESEEKMNRGDYSQTFDSVDSAKSWIDAQPELPRGFIGKGERGPYMTTVGLDTLDRGVVYWVFAFEGYAVVDLDGGPHEHMARVIERNFRRLYPAATVKVMELRWI